jgi:hypothetical protein
MLIRAFVATMIFSIAEKMRKKRFAALLCVTSAPSASPR